MSVKKPETIYNNMGFTKFVQLNLKKMPEIINLSSKNHSAVSFFFYLMEHCTTLNTIAITNSVTEDYKKCKSSIDKYLKILEQHDFIRINKKNGVKVIYLNDDICWKGPKKLRPLCEFKHVNNPEYKKMMYIGKLI